jgi:hypothetical protein
VRREEKRECVCFLELRSEGNHGGPEGCGGGLEESRASHGHINCLLTHNICDKLEVRTKIRAHY